MQDLVRAAQRQLALERRALLGNVSHVVAEMVRRCRARKMGVAPC